MKSKTIVIVGPTCTGKTSLAIKLCKKFNGSIISADSRQIVRYMDIGTGKVPVQRNNGCVEKKDDRWLLDGVDIFGYDLINPDDYFSAFDFVKYCKKVASTISRNGKNIFLVGGTGFYIDAVTGRVFLAGVSPDLELRNNLENLTTDQLAQKLLELDKETYKKIDIKNPARLTRAIEKALYLHKNKNIAVNRDVVNNFNDYTSALSQKDWAIGSNKFVFIGLTANREVLYSRADRWVEEIFGDKLFEEVKKIQTQFPRSSKLRGLIYKTVASYLAEAENSDGKVLTLEEAKQQVKYDMHAYIRRQQTWFKRNNSINWFDITHQNFDSHINSFVKLELNG